MAKADVLARVRADLAAGHTHVAVQRLRTLLAVLPNDLEVRALLTSVYRQTGNPVEAGRWGFLTEEVRESELAAFAKANPDPWQRLRLLHFDGDPVGLSEAAAQRLVQLADEAEKSGPPTRWVGSYRAPAKSRGVALPCLFTTVILAVALALVGIGAWKIMGYLLE
ncbi:hypothetical protein Cs7R123_40330 [Catellatospora sp. TT07R-123]|uniref:DUF6584 family protein n=1 Tax=Catellatospora sp. TT07R-123 TaxID=2733863 RepID=UPI001B12D385|nr:DUF6584 family protein [Catellatospora sp. TT07R-123]GHJ46691.1 hypothetical protein Cs7R123_40330 [Catellatospora sp. TT07R-123]